MAFHYVKLILVWSGFRKLFDVQLLAMFLPGTSGSLFRDFAFHDVILVRIKRISGLRMPSYQNTLFVGHLKSGFMSHPIRLFKINNDLLTP